MNAGDGHLQLHSLLGVNSFWQTVQWSSRDDGTQVNTRVMASSYHHPSTADFFHVSGRKGSWRVFRASMGWSFSVSSQTTAAREDPHELIAFLKGMSPYEVDRTETTHPSICQKGAQQHFRLAVVDLLQGLVGDNVGSFDRLNYVGDQTSNGPIDVLIDTGKERPTGPRGSLSTFLQLVRFFHTNLVDQLEVCVVFA